MEKHLLLYTSRLRATFKGPSKVENEAMPLSLQSYLSIKTQAGYIVEDSKWMSLKHTYRSLV